jgi:hypothetical protein
MFVRVTNGQSATLVTRLKTRWFMFYSSFLRFDNNSFNFNKNDYKAHDGEKDNIRSDARAIQLQRKLEWLASVNNILYFAHFFVYLLVNCGELGSENRPKSADSKWGVIPISTMLFCTDGLCHCPVPQLYMLVMDCRQGQSPSFSSCCGDQRDPSSVLWPVGKRLGAYFG